MNFNSKFCRYSIDLETGEFNIDHKWIGWIAITNWMLGFISRHYIINNLLVSGLLILASTIMGAWYINSSISKEDIKQIIKKYPELFKKENKKK